MDDLKKVSPAVVSRLPRYLRCINKFLINGQKKISSNELSEKMGYTASQIRQDFNNFGSFGQQGYGYKADKLLEELKSIIGLGRKYNLIVVGGGNLGQALVNYKGFEDYGFNIKAVFDTNPKLIGISLRNIMIYDIDLLEPFIKSNDIDIAILTVPAKSAEKTAAKLVDCGIKAILNFAPIDIELPEQAVIENVHLTESLMMLIYKLNSMNKQ